MRLTRKFDLRSCAALVSVVKRGLVEGSYDAVQRCAEWRVERGAATAEAYVPLSFAPGEAYQFDWSHEVVLINGTTVTVKVAHPCSPSPGRDR